VKRALVIVLNLSLAAILAIVAVRATADLPFLLALAIVVPLGLALKAVFRLTGLEEWLSKFWGSRAHAGVDGTDGRTPDDHD
jgi:hypothetical protein